MVAKCADSNCSATFTNLREGRVFVDEGFPSFDGSTRLRYAWLCTECSKRSTIVFDRETGEPRVVPLTRATPRVPLASTGVETLIQVVERVMKS